MGKDFKSSNASETTYVAADMLDQIFDRAEKGQEVSLLDAHLVSAAAQVAQAKAIIELTHSLGES